MPEPRKVTVACPTCDVRIRITVKPEHEGKRTQLTCRCGQQFRVRLPERPVDEDAARRLAQRLGVDLNSFRSNPFRY